jgi:hypothetical protein
MKKKPEKIGMLYQQVDQAFGVRVTVQEAFGGKEAESDIIRALDKANREYPSLTSLGLTPQLDKADLDKLLIARNAWFQKWFVDGWTP